MLSMPSAAPGKEAPAAAPGAEIEVEPMEEGEEGPDLSVVPVEVLEAELARRKAEEGAGAPPAALPV